MGNESKADAAIRDHTGYAMIAAMIPVPIADILAVTAVQLDLVKQLAGIYEMKYDETRGKAIVAALAGATLARVGGSAVKVLPGVGTMIGAGTQLVLSGASTYAIGQVFKAHFDNGGTIDTFNPTSVKGIYQSLVEKGKDVASSLRPSGDEASEPVERVAKTLDKLSRLREADSLSDQEFADLKAKLLRPERC